MNDPPRHPDLAESLSALALHALAPGEAATLDSHLRHCQACRTELDELHELAAALALPSGDPPAYLWDRILTAVADPRQP